jgi:hypothetical protein
MRDLDYSKVHDIEFDDVDMNDYPDFCDAYISSATIENEDGTFRDATYEEIEALNDDTAFVYETLLDQIL